MNCSILGASVNLINFLLASMSRSLIPFAGGLVAIVLAAGCGSMAFDSMSLSRDDTTAGATGPGTASGADTGGSGSTSEHEYTGDGGGGEANSSSVDGASCGGGCIPGTGTDSACTLSGTGGAGGGEALGSCKLGVIDQAVTGVCTLSGTETDGGPCLTSSDCGGGFGCVEMGVCRAYCCGDPEACAGGSFCAPRPIVAVEVSSQIITVPSLPVCTPVEPCTLLDDTTCTHPGDTCTIVRADGTASCVVPGSGVLDEACPCAAGFFCSATGTCQKLCHADSAGDCPPAFQCSGGTKQFPDGFGVCVKL
ncbi:MAG: hypothetical protein EXR75_13320 [Myxococcales bacterium]|nr:hypothetical protein [Myxococcales bacterium]